MLALSGAAMQEKMRNHDATHAAVCPMLVGRDVLGYVVVMLSADQPALTRVQRGALAEVGRTLGPMVLNARLRSTEQRLLAELQELDRYKGELIATISHELKTPLTSIIGHTELLEDGASLDVSLSAITRNARRLQMLIDNLLSYSKLQEQRSSTRRLVDLASLAAGSIETLAVQLERGRLTISLDAPPEPVCVPGDPEELRRVFDNLCGNAVKYSPSGGHIHVVVGSDAEGACCLRLRPRPGDLASGPGPPVLGLPPLLQPRCAVDPRDGTRPGDLAPDRGAARGHDLGGVRARAGQHVHGQTAVGTGSASRD